MKPVSWYSLAVEYLGGDEVGVGRVAVMLDHGKCIFGQPTIEHRLRADEWTKLPDTLNVEVRVQNEIIEFRRGEPGVHEYASRVMVHTARGVVAQVSLTLEELHPLFVSPPG